MTQQERKNSSGPSPLGDPPAKERPRRFDRATKDIALKILIDYSAATGKRWTIIRDEIVDTLQLPVTDAAPLIIRQDFEAWASGRSVIGDDKFKYVYDFLTHPKTLRRPEFARTAGAMEPALAAQALGAMMASFFDSRLERFPDWGPDEADVLSGKTLASDPAVLPIHTLSFSRNPEDPFYVVHGFQWRDGFPQPDTNPRNVLHYSGFGFMSARGNRLILKNQLTGDVGLLGFEVRWVPSRAQRIRIVGSLIVFDDLFDQVLAQYSEIKKDVVDGLLSEVKWSVL